MESGDAVIDGDGVVVDLAELDADQALELLNTAVALERRAEADQLKIAAHWADLHSGDALDHNTSALPGRERARTIGGDGTPAIGELCVGEFAVVAGWSTSTGTKLIADALDLRHRFPQIWARLCHYQVPVWICRKIADKTGHLSLAAARYVDAAVAPYLTSLPPGRLFPLLEAKIFEADPADAEARARHFQAQRFVRTGRTTDCGIKTLIARAEAGDVIMFTALCDRIAQILGLNGDTATLDVRRSKAIGIIANPLRTITLLAAHEGRNLTQPPEPAPDPAEDADYAWTRLAEPWTQPETEERNPSSASATLVDSGRVEDPAPITHSGVFCDREPLTRTGRFEDSESLIDSGDVGVPEPVSDPGGFDDREPATRTGGFEDSESLIDSGGVGPVSDPGGFDDREPATRTGGFEDSESLIDSGGVGPVSDPGGFDDRETPADHRVFGDPGPDAPAAAEPEPADSAGIVDHRPETGPADEPVITETDLHPADIDPYQAVDYAAELQALLDRYRISPRDLLPKTVVYLHVDRDTIVKNSGVVRVEDVGPITAEQFKHWIRGKHLTITPVIDPNNTPAADAYEASDRIKDALRMITPAEAFPYGTNTTRRIDHDHAIPYRPPPTGPPGQTSTDSLGRLGRRSHRYKTHAGWQIRIPETGTAIWRTPHGWYFLTNPAGTLPLGNGNYAHTIWNTMINDFTTTRYPADNDPDPEELSG